MLGGLLGGGGAGGILSGGLGDLLKQFQQNGQGDKAQSWIGSGPNKPVLPSEIEQVLGPDKISWLMQENGMSRADLLGGLSRELPQVVDKLTPDGRIPTEQEAACQSAPKFDPRSASNVGSRFDTQATIHLPVLRWTMARPSAKPDLRSIRRVTASRTREDQR